MRNSKTLKISPAPWFARLGAMEGTYVNSGSEDNEDGQVLIADCGKCNDDLNHANALMAAAAPDMYHWLNEIVMAYLEGKTNDWGYLMMQGEKALRKAITGESVS